MTAIVLLTHRDIGEAMVGAARHILGESPPALVCLTLEGDQALGALRDELRRTIRELDHGDGVLILTDLYGATPANLAAEMLAPGHVCCVSGLNLSMLLRALTHREGGLEAARAAALSGGREGVLCADEQRQLWQRGGGGHADGV